MEVLKKIRDYFCYCGIDKEEFKAIKKETRISNFEVWRLLHILMTAAFTFLFINSLFNEMFKQNMIFYIFALSYSVVVSCLFFILKKDSPIAQVIIYLSITVLFLVGCLVTQNKPTLPATTFIVMLLITPMFMIDRPYCMTIEIIVVSIIFVIWMYYAKDYEVWKMDFANIIIYGVLGIFIHIIANSVRIKEFVLTRRINIQKDLDELTGINNKGAITREINEFLNNPTENKGIMFILDIDNFKDVNDTYGHDVGDSIICQLGKYLGNRFTENEIVGRFGGDEFIIFIKDSDKEEYASRIAQDMIIGARENCNLPNREQKISISIGVAIYRGEEKNYSELFKKADMALYKIKGKSPGQYEIY